MEGCWDLPLILPVLSQALGPSRPAFHSHLLLGSLPSPSQVPLRNNISEMHSVPALFLREMSRWAHAALCELACSIFCSSPPTAPVTPSPSGMPARTPICCLLAQPCHPLAWCRPRPTDVSCFSPSLPQPGPTLLWAGISWSPTCSLCPPGGAQSAG